MLTNEADILIIGAGAAGMMAAYGAATTGQGKRVVVLEKMPRPGRKIMITGKGRCNFTNVKAWNEFQAHVHPKANFLRPAFYNLPPEKLIGFFESCGMKTVVERGDRAYPASMLASDVVDTLVGAVTGAGAEIVCNCEVRELRHDGEMFQIETGMGHWQARKLIVTTGGLSYPKTGSTGDGYAWAEFFGHSIRKCLPSLTALVPKGYKTETPEPRMKGHIDRSAPLSELGESLCGVQLKNVDASIVIDGKLAQDEFGDLDFTDGGIEGPIGFRLSRKCVGAIANGSKVRLLLDMKPAVEIDELDARIQALWKEVCDDRRSEGKPYKTRFGVLLGKVLPRELVAPFSKMNPDTDHKRLARVLKGWAFDIVGFVGYERAVVTAGGVSTEEISPKTLESRLRSGLYFAGEVIDLDADTGGYNLQIAFSSGYLAGISAAK